MVNCPSCDAVIDVEEEDLDEGDTLACDECGATMNVSSLDPLEVELADDEEDEDEDDEDFDFDDDDEDEDEEEEEEDEDWK
jgi:alpha-aminoadipate carrier protein LysW